MASLVFAGNYASTLAANYEGAVISAGGVLSTNQRNAVRTFIQTGRVAGWYDKIIDCCPFLGSNLAACLVKLVAASGAGTSYVNHNFVSGDYSTSVGLSVSGNKTKYLGTGVIPADQSLTNSNLSVGVGGVLTAAYSAQGLFGCDEADAGTVAVIGGGPFGGLGNRSQSVSWTRSYSAAVSYGSGTTRGAVDGIGVMDLAANASEGALSNELEVFRLTKFGVKYITDTASVGFFFVGSEMTLAELRSITTAARQMHLSARGIAPASRDLFIGDSITAGQGVTKSLSWPELVAAGDGSDDVCNLGMPGSEMLTDSASGLAGQHRVTGADSFTVARAYIMMGANDITIEDGTANGDATVLTAYRAALANTANTLKAQGAEVVISTITAQNGGNNKTKQLAWADAALGAATDAGVIGVDVCRPMWVGDNPGQYLIDTVHPNETGHALVASTILAAL